MSEKNDNILERVSLINDSLKSINYYESKFQCNKHIKKYNVLKSYNEDNIEDLIQMKKSIESFSSDITNQVLDKNLAYQPVVIKTKNTRK